MNASRIHRPLSFLLRLRRTALRPAWWLGLALLLPAVGMAQSSLRTVPEGTRLSNNLVTPIYVERLDPAGRGTVMRIRLRDASGYRVDVFAERSMEFDDQGESHRTLHLYLHQPPGRQGSEAIAARSDREKAFLTALQAGLEHYVPGWTSNWSIEGHTELRDLVRDLATRQQGR